MISGWQNGDRVGNLSRLYVLTTTMLSAFEIAVFAGAKLGELTNGVVPQDALRGSGRGMAAIQIVLLLLSALVIFLNEAALTATKSPKWLRISFNAVLAFNLLEFFLNCITPSVTALFIWGQMYGLLFVIVIAIAWTQRQARRKDKTL